MLDNLKKLARLKAGSDRTGWARRGDVMVAYYPRCNRFAYFLRHLGVVNRRDIEQHIRGVR